MIEIRHVEPSGLRSAYNQLYRAGSTEHSDAYYRWLLRLLAPVPGRSLLDVSCGEGALLRCATEAGLDAWGLDLSDRAARAARDRAQRAVTIVGDGEGLPFSDASFDYVTNIGSLEHFAEPELGVREMARVLAPSGRLLVLLPNAFGLTWNFRNVWRTGDVFDDGQPIQRYATLGQWRRLLCGGGLEVQHVEPYFVTYPDDLTGWLEFLSHPSRTLLALAFELGVLPTSVANCLVYICGKPVPGTDGAATRAAAYP